MVIGWRSIEMAVRRPIKGRGSIKVAMRWSIEMTIVRVIKMTIVRVIEMPRWWSMEGRGSIRVSRGWPAPGSSSWSRPPGCTE